MTVPTSNAVPQVSEYIQSDRDPPTYEHPFKAAIGNCFK